jgi:hypothetical protein
MKGYCCWRMQSLVDPLSLLCSSKDGVDGLLPSLTDPQCLLCLSKDELGDLLPSPADL